LNEQQCRSEEGRVQCPIKLFAALAGEIRNFRDEQEID
jgi:hypothetical protein